MSSYKHPELEAYRRLVTEDQAQLRDHPSPETLLDYFDGLLEHAEEEVVCSHLADCRACAQAFLTLTEPLETQDQQPQQKAPLPTGPSPQPPSATHRLVSPFAGLMIAALLVACVGLSALLWRNQSTNLGGSGLQANPILVDLMPNKERLRSLESKKVVLPPDRPGGVLLLNTTHTESYEAYHLEIHRGDVLLPQSLPLLRAEEGLFTLFLARNVLPPGDYNLHIVGKQVNGAHKLVAVYEIQLVEE